MKAGVSTACLYPRLLEEALYDLAVNGVGCVELFFNTDCELSKHFVSGLKSTLDRFEMTVSSVHPYTCAIDSMMFYSPYERRVDDMLDYYKKYFLACQWLEAEFFVHHGCRNIKLPSDEFYFSRYERIYDAGREFGVTVCQENVKDYSASRLRFLKDMSAALGDKANFVLDTKQCIRSGENAFDYVRALGSKIKHVHISDSGERGDCLLMGRGRFDYRGFLSALSKAGFDGAVILELYRTNFDSISDLVNSYNIIDNAVKRVE